MTKNPPQLLEAHLIFLRHSVKKMHYRGEFDHLNLRRFISKHCKTFLLGNRLGLKLKKSDHGLFCYIGETSDGITLIEVHSSKFPNREFKLNVQNNKEFLEKILKHDLL